MVHQKPLSDAIPLAPASTLAVTGNAVKTFFIFLDREEFHRGRPVAWYWRQVLLAIIVGCASEVRHHRVLTIRAILITWAANYGALLVGRGVLVGLFENFRLSGPTIQLALWAICFLGGAASGLIVAFLHRRYRNAMLLTSAGALLGWALIAIMLLKRGALQHSLLQIAGATLVYYLVALTGFAIGGFLLISAPKPGTPPSRHTMS